MLYFANQRLFRTADGGEHWAPISPDLTRPDAGIPPNLDAPTAADDDHVDKRRGVIYTIAPSPLAADALWVGTDDGLVWRTHDAGAHWRDVTPPALDAVVESGAASSSRISIRRPRISRSTGIAWTMTPRTSIAPQTAARAGHASTRAFARDAFVNVVREDPVRRGLLYAGTERGMFVSFDDGAHWQPLQQNLPMTSVRDIDVHGDDLVIATHGRGFWIMDDVSALRQMGPLHRMRSRCSNPRRPSACARRVSPARPCPRDEPLAANPPDGALIDYALPAAIAGPVTLTILDAQNHPVRRYSSADQVRHRPTRPSSSSRLNGFRSSVIVSRRARDASLRLELCATRASHPPRSPDCRRPACGRRPAATRSSSNVGGRRYEQPLQVEPDPRVRVSTAALQREFVLARLIDQAGAQAAAARDQARKLLEALEPRLAQPGAPQAKIASLMARAMALSGMSPPSRPPNAPGLKPLRTDSLQALSTDLKKLEGAVDGADADPGPDARTAYAALSRTLAATLAEWRHFLDQDLTTLNRELGAAGQAPVAGP